jgi:hypothetical protein
MKAQTKDAVAMAMDWLAQLREEDGAEPAPGDNKPAIDSAPPAGDSGDVSPAAAPAGELGDAAPAPRPAIDWGDAAPAVLPAIAWGSARPAAPPADDFEDAAPAMPRADGSWPAAAPPPPIDWDDVSLVAPPAADWEQAGPAAHPTVAWGDTRPAAPPATDWEDAALAVPPETTPPGRAGIKASFEITERAAIGDELRIPLAWCEMGSCISHYADPAALGEADIRARAIAAGWRVDALGQLACPQCLQGDPLFQTAQPVALWDRDRAVAMTALMAAVMRQMAGADGAARMRRGASFGRGASAPLGRKRAAAFGAEHAAALGGDLASVPGREPAAVPGPRPEMARQPGRGRHRGHPAHPDRAQ